MHRYAPMERAALADALAQAGPDAPTLCDGWTGYDLAAHVVVRERRPDTGPGVLVKAFSGWTERVRRQYRKDHTFTELIDMIRQVPWWSPLNMASLDEVTNLLEYYVHTEDVLRARPDFQPRDLDPGLQAAMWKRVPGLARLNLRSFRAAVKVRGTGFGEATAGAGGPEVTVTGEPGELVLFFFGRQSASLAEVTGPEQLTEKLTRAKLGL